MGAPAAMTHRARRLGVLALVLLALVALALTPAAASARDKPPKPVQSNVVATFD